MYNNEKILELQLCKPGWGGGGGVFLFNSFRHNTILLDTPMMIQDDVTFRHFVDVSQTLDVLEWMRM